MFEVTRNATGQCTTPGPVDVCKTPSPAGPVPLPYPNLGMCSDGSGSKKVKVKGNESLRKGDKLSKSSLDTPGTAMGVKSSRVMAKVVFKKGTSKVKVQGKQWAHHAVPTEHNNGNTMGFHTVPC